MKTRKARAVIYYNGKNIMKDLKDYATSFSYEDPASSECDTINLSIADPLGQWIGAWLPSKGDKIKASIVFENKEKENQNEVKKCGDFLLDDFSFSESSSGRVLQISGISAPLDEAFKATERSKNYINVTIDQIASEIADRYNMKLLYHCNKIILSKKEQSKQTDSDFLQSLCKDYGLSLKTYSNIIIIFDREKYKKAKTIKQINRSDLINFSWNTTLQGTYTGAEIEYTSIKNNKTHTYKVGNGNRILKVNTRASSEEDAKLLIEAALNEANHNQTTISLTLIGETNLSASQNILLTGFGQLSGKYYIDKKTDSVSSSGYTTSLECSKVQENDNEVACYAIDHLFNLGVIDNPTYWKKNLNKLKYLADLFINADASIKVVGAGIYLNVSSAIEALYKRGVINNRDYWISTYNKLSQLDKLLIKLANASEDLTDRKVQQEKINSLLKKEGS